MTACALAVADVTLPVTSIGNTGEDPATLAVNDPFIWKGRLWSSVAFTTIVPLLPLHVAVKGSTKIVASGGLKGQSAPGLCAPALLFAPPIETVPDSEPGWQR